MPIPALDHAAIVASPWFWLLVVFVAFIAVGFISVWRKRGD